MGRTGDLLSELEASFDAAVARQEDEAVADLARSFRNDESLAGSLARGGPSCVLMDDGAHTKVVEVGTDYALAGVDPVVLVRLDSASFVTGGAGGKPRRTDLSWLAVASEWASGGRKVQVRVLERAVEGQLVTAARDFLTVDDGRRTVLVPHASIVYVRSYPED